MSIQSKIESILFVASKPLQAKKIASILKSKEVEVNDALQALQSKYNGEDSGVVLIKNNDEWQMAANPDNRQQAENFMKAEVSGELTRPQLETLTVVSYCGPITKPELEQIRGVNCSLILRNLMMRGLVQESSNITKLLPAYEITLDYLRLLGLNNLEDLPDYKSLHD